MSIYCFPFITLLPICASLSQAYFLASEFKLSLTACLRLIQHDSFPLGIWGKVYLSTSDLLKLIHFLDQSSILRVGGRLERADFSYSTKHSHILSSTTVLNKSKYKTAPNKISIKIPGCHWWPPHVTIGWFVSTLLSIKQELATLVQWTSRWATKRKKRYGCLRICPFTRAVNIKMAYLLDADSFLLAIYLFVSHRGTPLSHLLRQWNKSCCWWTIVMRRYFEMESAKAY